eukprot:COSAG01_NODE_443_length_17009_cov_20.575163_4_plen_118_part_00
MLGHRAFCRFSGILQAAPTREPAAALAAASGASKWTGPGGQGYGPCHVEPEMLGKLAQLLVETDELDWFARLPDRGADCRCAVSVLVPSAYMVAGLFLLMAVGRGEGTEQECIHQDT